MTTNTDTQAHGGGVEAVRSDGWQAEAEARASALAERAGIDMLEDHGEFLADLEQTLIEFAEWASKLAASPAAPAPAAGVEMVRIVGSGLRAVFYRDGVFEQDQVAAAAEYSKNVAAGVFAALIDEHLTPDFADDGNCCAGKLAAPDAKGER